MQVMKRSAPRPPLSGSTQLHEISIEPLSSLDDSPTAVAPLLRGAGGLMLLGLGALSVDVPVAAWFKDGTWPAAMPRWLVKVAEEIHHLVTLSEVIGHTVSVAVLLGLIVALDPTLAWPRWRAPAFGRPSRQPTVVPSNQPSGQPTPAQATFARFLGATFTGGILTDIVKLLVDRVRPRAADFVNHGSVWDSFSEAVIATITGSASNVNSFPSGHSAIAAGFAAALAWKYPRAWIAFAIFAAMAASQRIVSSAHFPSDACFGAALGLLGASLFLRWKPWCPASPPPGRSDPGEGDANGSPTGDAV